jgi:hypothetical protein
MATLNTGATVTVRSLTVSAGDGTGVVGLTPQTTGTPAGIPVGGVGLLADSAGHFQVAEAAGARATFVNSPGDLTYTLPATTGTVALVSDLAGYVDLASTQTLAGKTMDLAANTLTIGGTDITQLVGVTGSVVATASGAITTAGVTIYYSKNGNTVTIEAAASTFTSTGPTIIQIATLPAGFRPARAAAAPVGVIDGGLVSLLPGLLRVNAAGVVTIYKDLAQSTFSGSTTVGFDTWQITFIV